MALQESGSRGSFYRMSTVKAAPREKPRIDVREAVQAAADYLQRLYSVDSVLEEVELSEDGNFWLITLSYEAPRKSALGHELAGTSIGKVLMPPETKFKIFKVNAQDGAVTSMRIRSLE